MRAPRFAASTVRVESLRKGMPLVIFPEGGRSRDGRLQDFMGGAFYMAIKAQAPVVPIVLVGTYELLPMNSFHLHPGVVEMIIGEPISTKGMVPRDMDKLAAQRERSDGRRCITRVRRCLLPSWWQTSM